jgi:hypothetical protein
MRRRYTAILLAVTVLVPLAAAPAAPAKRKKVKRPTVTRVTPMRVRVGARLAIRGRNFSSRRRRNTVVFRTPGGRTAFAKPRRASRRKLVVVVPTVLGRVLRSSGSGRTSARVRMRVLVGRTFGRWTRRRLSPVVVTGARGGGSGGGSTACSRGDHDGDLLSGSFENDINTDPCVADTDGDGVEDGYEEQSALDLSHYPATPPLPYPGRRPYANALDPSDGNTDHDGDVMTLREEFLMWRRFSSDGVRRSGRPTTLSGLLYSDGLQRSRSVAAPAEGSLRDWALDQDENNSLSDDERDVDGDGLANWDEARGQFVETWWPKIHDGQDEPKESKYPGINFLDNQDLPRRDAFANSDLDGDGLGDGADDHDHDGLTNQFEVRRPGDWFTDTFDIAPGFSGDNIWAYTNPFNPCKPYNSERCHAHPPVGYYQDDDVPPIGPNPPAGYPSVHPTRPQDGDG